MKTAEKAVKRGELGVGDAKSVLECLDFFDTVFGVNYEPHVGMAYAEE